MYWQEPADSPEVADEREQMMIQESARAMSEREIVPIMCTHAPEQPLPKAAVLQILQKCAAQGLTSARVPEDAGGAGLPVLTLGLMLEQLAKSIRLERTTDHGPLRRHPPLHSGDRAAELRACRRPADRAFLTLRRMLSRQFQ